MARSEPVWHLQSQRPRIAFRHSRSRRTYYVEHADAQAMACKINADPADRVLGGRRELGSGTDPTT